MTTATTQTLANLEDNMVLRLVALALERLQRRRQLPRAKGKLHRV